VNFGGRWCAVLCVLCIGGSWCEGMNAGGHSKVSRTAPTPPHPPLYSFLCPPTPHRTIPEGLRVKIDAPVRLVAQPVGNDLRYVGHNLLDVLTAAGKAGRPHEAEHAQHELVYGGTGEGGGMAAALVAQKQKCRGVKKQQCLLGRCLAA
jgi:hypothetical protein